MKWPISFDETARFVKSFSRLVRTENRNPLIPSGFSKPLKIPVFRLFSAAPRPESAKSALPYLDNPPFRTKHFSRICGVPLGRMHEDFFMEKLDGLKKVYNFVLANDG